MNTALTRLTQSENLRQLTGGRKTAPGRYHDISDQGGTERAASAIVAEERKSFQSINRKIGLQSLTPLWTPNTYVCRCLYAEIALTVRSQHKD